MSAFSIFAATLFASAGIGSIALTTAMLWRYRAKIAAALLFEPIQQEGRHASGR